MNNVIIWIIIVGLIVAILAVIFNRWSEREQEQSQASSQDSDQSKNLPTPTKIGIIAGLVALAVGIVVAYMFIREGNAGKGESSGASIATFVPIWVAIMIPFMVSKNKQQATVNQKKVLILLAIGLILMTALGVFLFLKVNWL